MMLMLSPLIVSSHPFRYVVCKGLRPNIQDVLEHMFNANVRINKMKNQDIDDVMEVGRSLNLLLHTFNSSTCSPLVNGEFMEMFSRGRQI